MHILVLNWRDSKNPTAGGAEMVVDNIIRGLASMGHRVTLFTSEFKGCKKEERTKYAKIIRSGSINTVYTHAFLYGTQHRDEFDFVIESVSAVPFFTPLYFDSRRIIIIPHHIVRDIIFKELKFPKSLVAYTAESSIPVLYRKANFIAVSEAVRSDLIRFGVAPNRITVCYFGVPIVFKPVRLRKFEKPTLITVSRLMRYKRVDLILDAVKEMSNRIDLQLIVGSSGKELGALKSQAKMLGIGGMVKFVGRIGEAEKSRLLAKSWVYASASEREGFGVSALEAEMCGTPVVGFNVGGLGEAVMRNRTGFLVKDGERKEFTQKILRLLSDKKLRERFSKNSIEFGRRFDPRAGVRKIDKIMSKSISGDGS